MSSKTMLPPAALGTNKDTVVAEMNNRQGCKWHAVKVIHNYYSNINLIWDNKLFKMAVSETELCIMCCSIKEGL